MKLLVAMVLMLTSSVASVAQDGLNCRMKQTPAHYEVKAKNIAEAVIRISSDFGLPAGIEWVRDTTPIVKSFEGASVREILEATVLSSSSYGFDLNNNVVHVFWTPGKNDPANILNFRLESFTASNEYIKTVDNRLLKLAKAVVLPPTAGIPAGSGCAGSSAVGAGERKIAFSLTNVSVRDVLDEEVKTGGYPIWIVTFPSPRPKLTSGGYFSTDDSEFSSWRQPHWELLFWGFTPEGLFGPQWKPYAVDNFFSCSPAALVDWKTVPGRDHFKPLPTNP